MGALVSLVMSDIVDSTRRWNAAEGAMAADLEHHDHITRDVVTNAGGSVFKHTGDGMIAVFDDPVAAVTAAAAIQRHIADTTWQHPDGLRVRAAVHTGVVYPRDGDLFGTAVNKLARLLGTCPPGAVLVSGATTALLTDRAPEGLGLQPVGPVTLPGFATPDDTHALTGPGLTPATTNPTPATTPTAEIPAIHDELVGRTDELAAIWDAIGRSRLVTLIGVGGMGKTRLALEIAAGATTAYDGAVWWIDLAAATSAEAVVPVAMAAVGAREAPGRTALQAVCDRFRTVRGVVVLDNCEHVLAAARELIAGLRGTAPELRIVATSREALGLRGEHVVPVGSLPVHDGVALFRERAGRVQHDLAFGDQIPVIERICARLDGIPLAIELAAARCRSMTPAEIDARLDERFRLLRGGRDGVERHRTMQAAVAWSYSLLDADERAVFDQMAVFADGCFIDGLAAVTGFDEFDAREIVERLIARSMVVTTRSALGTRFHQLETLRQYAEDRLIETGTITDTRDRHLDWTLNLAVTLDGALGMEAEAAAFARFGAEADNLRVAVAHAVGTGRFGTACAIVAALAEYAVGAQQFELLDWVRPFPEDHAWTPESAACMAYALVADYLRGQLSTVPLHPAELPVWFARAPFKAQTHALNIWGVARGSDPQLSADLLHGLAPTGAEERARLAFVALGLAYPRLLRSPATPAEAVALGELATSGLAEARATGSARVLCLVVLGAAVGLSLVDPRRAAVLALESFELGERLGAPQFVDMGLAVLGVSGLEGLDVLPHRVLVTVRDRMRESIAQQHTYLAGVAGAAALPLVGRHEPETALRYCDAWERVIGRDLRPLLARWGVVAAPDRPISDVALADVVGSMLALVERLVAEAADIAPGGGS